MRGNEGAMHTRLAGRDGGVAGRYKKMWLGGRREYTSAFVFWENPDAIRAFRRFPRGCHFFVLPD